MAVTQSDVSKMRLVLVQSGSDTSVGDYSITDNKVRDKKIWVNQSSSRMMFFAGNKWVIADSQYMQEVIDAVRTGGLYDSKSSTADVPFKADWGPKYRVSELYLKSGSRWVPAS